MRKGGFSQKVCRVSQQVVKVCPLSESVFSCNYGCIFLELWEKGDLEYGCKSSSSRIYCLASPPYLQESLITLLVLSGTQAEKREQDIGGSVANYHIIIPSHPCPMVPAEKGKHASKWIMSGSYCQ